MAACWAKNKIKKSGNPKLGWLWNFYSLKGLFYGSHHHANFERWRKTFSETKLIKSKVSEMNMSAGKFLLIYFSANDFFNIFFLLKYFAFEIFFRFPALSLLLDSCYIYVSIIKLKQLKWFLTFASREASSWEAYPKKYNFVSSCCESFRLLTGTRTITLPTLNNKEEKKI